MKIKIYICFLAFLAVGVSAEASDTFNKLFELQMDGVNYIYGIKGERYKKMEQWNQAEDVVPADLNTIVALAKKVVRKRLPEIQGFRIVSITISTLSGRGDSGKYYYSFIFEPEEKDRFFDGFNHYLSVVLLPDGSVVTPVDLDGVAYEDPFVESGNRRQQEKEEANEAWPQTKRDVK